MEVQVTTTQPKVEITPGGIQVVTVGLQGPPGISSGVFQHTQSAPLSLWNVNHNLGYRPNVGLYSSGGLLMLAEVLHLSTNQTQIFFDQPTSGYAVFS